jgi:hypothetical protein
MPVTGVRKHNAIFKNLCHCFADGTLRLLLSCFEHAKPIRTKELAAGMQTRTACFSTWLVMSVAMSTADHITKLHLLRCLNAISSQYFSPGSTLVISTPNFEDTPRINEAATERSLDKQKIPKSTYIKLEKLRVPSDNSYISAEIKITDSYKKENSRNFNKKEQNEWDIANKNRVTRNLNADSHKAKKFNTDKQYYKYINQSTRYLHNGTTSQKVSDAYSNKGTSKYFNIFSNEKMKNTLDFAYQVIQLVHEPLKWPLVISSTDGIGHHAKKYKDANYIIITCTMNAPEEVREHTERQLEALRARASWNPRGKFLVLVTEDYGQYRTVLVKQLLQLSWNFKVINAIVVIPSQKSALVLYTWFPYQSPGMCTNVRETVLNYWIFEDSGRFLLSSPLFERKIPHDLKGCSIAVSTIEIEPFVILPCSNVTNLLLAGGLEGRLFRFVMKELNLRYKLKLPRNGGWGEKLSNNTWTGLKGDLFDGVTELGFGGLLLDTELCEVFECTATYLKDTLVWHVPRAKQVPHWEGLYRVFEKETWAVIFGLGIAVALLLWYMGFLSKETSYETLTKSLSHVWAVVLGVSVPKLPRAFKPRLLFLFWVIYCLHINAVYLSFLTSFIINPGFEHQVRTVDELVRSKLNYGYHSGFDKYFNDTSDQTLVTILSRRKHCDGDGSDCLRRMAETGDFAMLVSSMLVQYKNALESSNQSGKTLFNRFDGTFLSYDFVMYLTKGSQLLERLDCILQRTVEAGLLQQWWEEMKFTLTLQQDLRTEEGSSTLSFSHLRSVFLFLLLGLLISFVAFIGEFLSSHGLMMIKQCQADIRQMSVVE